jgi:GNAT superfamily N-acetyltransferase
VNTEPAREYIIEALGDRHDRSRFSCGVEPLDRYFRDRAGQDARRNIATPFVLIHRATQEACGFYTVANTAICLQELPLDVARRLPKYPFVPATLLGRLAVDTKHQGKGLGEFILLDALRRSRAASDQAASFAVVVDAKDEPATAFYRKYGFRALPAAPGRLFLPMKTIGQLFP